MRKVKETFKKVTAKVRDWLDEYKFLLAWITIILGYCAICTKISKWADRLQFKIGFGWSDSEVDEFNSLFKKMKSEDAPRIGKLIGEAILSILRRES